MTLLVFLFLILVFALAAPDTFRSAVHSLIPAVERDGAGAIRNPSTPDDALDRKIDRTLDRLGW